jgi:hypothetical protein
MVDLSLRLQDDRQESDHMPARTVQKIHGIHSGLLLTRFFRGTAFLVDPEPAHVFVFCVTKDSAKYHVTNFASADISSRRPNDDVSAVAIALKSRSVLKRV